MVSPNYRPLLDHWPHVQVIVCCHVLSFACAVVPLAKKTKLCGDEACTGMCNQSENSAARASEKLFEGKFHRSMTANDDRFLASKENDLVSIYAIKFSDRTDLMEGALLREPERRGSFFSSHITLDGYVDFLKSAVESNKTLFMISTDPRDHPGKKLVGLKSAYPELVRDYEVNSKRLAAEGVIPQAVPLNLEALDAKVIEALNHMGHGHSHAHGHSHDGIGHGHAHSHEPPPVATQATLKQAPIAAANNDGPDAAVQSAQQKAHSVPTPIAQGDPQLAAANLGAAQNTQNVSAVNIEPTSALPSAEQTPPAGTPIGSTGPELTTSSSGTPSNTQDLNNPTVVRQNVLVQSEEEDEIDRFIREEMEGMAKAAADAAVQGGNKSLLPQQSAAEEDEIDRFIREEMEGMAKAAADAAVQGSNKSLLPQQSAAGVAAQGASVDPKITPSSGQLPSNPNAQQHQPQKIFVLGAEGTVEQLSPQSQTVRPASVPMSQIPFDSAAQQLVAPAVPQQPVVRPSSVPVSEIPVADPSEIVQQQQPPQTVVQKQQPSQTVIPQQQQQPSQTIIQQQQQPSKTVAQQQQQHLQINDQRQQQPPQTAAQQQQQPSETVSQQQQQPRQINDQQQPSQTIIQQQQHSSQIVAQQQRQQQPHQMNDQQQPSQTIAQQQQQPSKTVAQQQQQHSQINDQQQPSQTVAQQQPSQTVAQQQKQPNTLVSDAAKVQTAETLTAGGLSFGIGAQVPPNLGTTTGGATVRTDLRHTDTVETQVHTSANNVANQGAQAGVSEQPVSDPVGSLPAQPTGQNPSGEIPVSNPAVDVPQLPTNSDLNIANHLPADSAPVDVPPSQSAFDYASSPQGPNIATEHLHSTLLANQSQARIAGLPLLGMLATRAASEGIPPEAIMVCPVAAASNPNVPPVAVPEPLTVSTVIPSVLVGLTGVQLEPAMSNGTDQLLSTKLHSSRISGDVGDLLQPVKSCLECALSQKLAATDPIREHSDATGLPKTKDMDATTYRESNNDTAKATVLEREDSHINETDTVETSVKTDQGDGHQAMPEAGADFPSGDNVAAHAQDSAQMAAKPEVKEVRTEIMEEDGLGYCIKGDCNRMFVDPEKNSDAASAQPQPGISVNPTTPLPTGQITAPSSVVQPPAKSAKEETHHQPSSQEPSIQPADGLPSQMGQDRSSPQGQQVVSQSPPAESVTQAPQNIQPAPSGLGKWLSRVIALFRYALPPSLAGIDDAGIVVSLMVPICLAIHLLRTFLLSDNSEQDAFDRRTLHDALTAVRERDEQIKASHSILLICINSLTTFEIVKHEYGLYGP
ncbi:unnamed protein product [Toxocara canis]|uniref:SPOC domain-containing protein n=1 Tax=Toxocara canis TaxID=6265 RepID=A0A183V4P4_TOXCA|nr:unnamed protein product [Toxocara canis]